MSRKNDQHDPEEMDVDAGGTVIDINGDFDNCCE